MEDLIIVDISLDDQQTRAIKLCSDMAHRLVAVTGAAGTGKTTIIRQIADMFAKQGISVAVAAPTGKAARRIKEATGIPAITVHKLLEYGRPGERDPDTGKAVDPTVPKRNRMNPLDYKVIIVDEYAMISYELHNALIAALPSAGCVRAFGDINQLPPIETNAVRWGSNKEPEPTPFQKLLSRPGDSVTLETVYRQQEGSHVLEMANKIRKGHTPLLNQDIGDWYVKLTDKPIPVLKEYVLAKLADGVDYRRIRNQIITPGRKTWVGTHQLNDVLRNLLNPEPTQELALPRYEWDKQPVTIYLGDKVVCTENSYDLRDYFERFAEFDTDGMPYQHSFIPCPDSKQMLNGETGIVTQMYPDGAIDVDFGDRVVEIPSIMSEWWAKRETIIDVQPLRAIDLAYALTTHKCQGSEFDEVIYVLNKSTQYNQSRQNFYTAVTRAKYKAMVITDQSSLRVSVLKVIR